MTAEEMRRRKEELNYTNEMISELSGVPLGTVQKVLSGTTAHPRYATRASLEAVLGDPPLMTPEIHEIIFGGRDAAPEHKRYTKLDVSMFCEPQTIYGEKSSGGNAVGPGTSGPAAAVGEGAVEYRTKKQGEYTLEDYYALPKEVRAELLDGEIFILEAPTNIHQQLIAELVYELKSYIKTQGGECMVFPAPCDVQLDCDNKTMVEPDVVLVCDRTKVKRRVVYGAPDLVMEVTSPSSVRRDLSQKLNKYRDAGVREYWVIEPDKRRILLYDFFGPDFLTIYGFDDVVPVGIYDGKCRIDFKAIYEDMRFMFEDPEDNGTS